MGVKKEPKMLIYFLMPDNLKDTNFMQILWSIYNN